MFKTLNGKYDAPQNKTWAKLKKEFEIDGLVIEKIPTKVPTTFNYVLAVGPISAAYAEAIGEKYTAHWKGRDYMIIGRSDATTFELKPGDILRVASEEVNIHHSEDPKYPRYAGYVMRVREPVPEKDAPDPVSVLTRLSELTPGRWSIAGKQEGPSELPKLKLPEFVWIPEFISLAGSLIYQHQQRVRHTPHDIDIILRADDLPGSDKFHLILDAALRLKLDRIIRANFGEDKDIQYTASPYGPNWDYVPVYDLVLKPRIPIIEEINEPEFSELFYKQEDPYLRYLNEDKEYRFIIDEHYRGSSCHWDLRFQDPERTALFGWTIFPLQPDVIDEPVTTMTQAREWHKNPKAWKFDWETGRVKLRRTRDGTLRPAELRARRKAEEPLPWFTFEGVVPPGEVGATANFPGVLLIVERGEIQTGAQKPYFHEYFLNSGKIKGRIVFRQISRQELAKIQDIENYDPSEMNDDQLGDDWRIVCAWWSSKKRGVQIKYSEEQILNLAVKIVRETLIRGKRGFHPDTMTEHARDLYDKVVSRLNREHWRLAIEKAEVLPPGVEEEQPQDPYFWAFIQTVDQTPYVLTREAVDKKWLPPKGFSALPREIRAVIPEEYRFWEASEESRRLELREKLVEKLKELNIDFDRILTKSDVEKARSYPYVLQWHYWKKVEVIRVGPSEQHFDLRVDVGKPELLHLVMEQNPQINDEVSGHEKPCRDKSSMKLGEKEPEYLEPSHGAKEGEKGYNPLNPTLDTPAYISMLEHGEVLLLEDSVNLKKLQFLGGKLKGVWLLQREEPGSKFWLMRRTSAGPGEKTLTLVLKGDLEKIEVAPRVIAGYASVAIVDKEGELVPIKALSRALQRFMAAEPYRNIMLIHSNVQVGECLPEYTDSKGNHWTTHVDDAGLFIVAQIRDDISLANEVWNRILSGQLRAFSIAGTALSREIVCNRGNCYLEVKDLELYEISICERGMNPAAKFSIIEGGPCGKCGSSCMLAPYLFMKSSSGALSFLVKPDEGEISRSLEELTAETGTLGKQVKPALEQGAESIRKENDRKMPDGKTEDTKPSGSGQPNVGTSNTEKAAPGSVPETPSPLLMEIKGLLEKVLGALEELKAAPKPEKYPPPSKKEGEGEGEEKGKPEKHPYPKKKEEEGEGGAAEGSEDEKAKKPEKHPYPSKKELVDETIPLVLAEIQKMFPATDKRSPLPSAGGPPDSGAKGPTLSEIHKMSWSEVEALAAKTRQGGT